MYGSNNFGQSYYGQGPAVGTVFILASVSAALVMLASISSQTLINKVISASIVMVASVNKLFNRTITASVTMLATFASAFFQALNIRHASTKLLTLASSTNPTSVFDRVTKALHLKNTTRSITDQ